MRERNLRPQPIMALVAVILMIISLAFSGTSSIAEDAKADRSHLNIGENGKAEYLQGEVIIKFKPFAQPSLKKSTEGTAQVGITSLDQVFQKHRSTEIKRMFPHDAPQHNSQEIDFTRHYDFFYSSGEDAMSVAREISRDPSVEYAEPRYIYRVQFTPNDSLYSFQVHLKKIQADLAWDVTQGNTTVIIGIVDTGVDWKHPDLAANIWHNPHPGSNPSFPNDSIGWDFAGFDGNHPDNDPSPGNPHGTHVAGDAAAVGNNRIGVTGVAPRCKIMAIKAGLDNPNSNIILYGYEGIKYAADNGAKIINTSWGGAGYSQIAREIVDYAFSKGALIVAAGGNDNTDALQYPSGYPRVLGVGSVDQNDVRSFFSNFGQQIQVMAPGENIWSTVPNGQYQNRGWTGTSMASPIAAGVAALVKSIHPTWTPDQIAQQVRVSADIIDTLNPDFVQQLGYGRVNAYRAVKDSNYKAVQMVSFVASDSTFGNNDGSFDPGETITIVGQFESFLSPTTNTTVQLTTFDPSVTVLNGTVNLGPMVTLQTKSNSTSPFTVRISQDVPENWVLKFIINITDGSYRDHTLFSIIAKPTYRDQNINNVTMTITSKGTLAFNDYPDNIQGSGFVYRPGGPENLLFEGAFMAGTDVNHVVDVARSANQSVQSSDFISKQRIIIRTPGTISNQDAVTAFSDESAASNKVGLRVRLNSYAFKQNQDADYVILKYTLVNTNAAPISNLYNGLYFDWDLGPNGQNNNARYDVSRRLGYIYNIDSTVIPTYAGVSLLSGQALPAFRAINNDNTVPGNPWGVYDGFTKAEKWESLSGGTSYNQEGPGDVSFVIGTGPLSIAPNDSIVVGYAVLAGNKLTDLQFHADAAARKWSNLVTEVRRTNVALPLIFQLYQNYPNPFNPSTIIRYDVAKESYVTLKVHNILGQEVLTLVDGRQPAGQYEVPLSALQLPSGVYFYKLQAGTFVDVKKMLLLK